MSTSEKCYEEKWNRVRSIENDRGVCSFRFNRTFCWVCSLAESSIGRRGQNQGDSIGGCLVIQVRNDGGLDWGEK